MTKTKKIVITALIGTALSFTGVAAVTVVGTGVFLLSRTAYKQSVFQDAYYHGSDRAAFTIVRNRWEEDYMQWTEREAALLRGGR